MKQQSILRLLFMITTMALASVIVIAQKNEFFHNTNGKFALPPLPYKSDALEPVISQRTMELHHGKHLKAYIDNLNKQISGSLFENKDLISIVKESKGGMFNNAGQTLNHALYFSSFSPNPQSAPTGKLLQAIESQWGSFEKFKEEFSRQGVTLFGSGWVWLSKDNNGQLHISQEKNAGNPVVRDLTPLLGFDVWEHAYYLDYENRRQEYIDNLWKIIDWKVIENRFNNK